jgi:hypothetical protein
MEGNFAVDYLSDSVGVHPRLVLREATMRNDSDIFVGEIRQKLPNRRAVKLIPMRTSGNQTGFYPLNPLNQFTKN